MSSDDHGVIRKRFDEPDETRPMELGQYELIRVGDAEVGRATYQPGWKWSEHVGPGVGKRLCDVEHVGLVLHGTCTVAFDDGTVIELKPGDAFYVPPTPHDSWVVGDEPYVSLHLAGASAYAKEA
jgi:quercetin dioxygenase-like cupin family protein